MGYKCNQKCLHCHVNAGPTRKEMMGKETINQVIEFIELNQIKTVDLTGGAPEMNEHFKYLVEVCANKNIHVIDRCNLTILNEEGMSELPYFLARNKVEIVASLPCYMEENVDAQRGKGVFEVSIKVLKLLNEIGYGINKELQINLVYNPQGAVLPPKQYKLESEYKYFLKNKFNIQFNNLYTITNMPIKRFGSTLVSKKKFKEYMMLLKDAFSKKTLENVMCKSLISIDYNGYVYDCDFNQMLNIPLSNEKLHISSSDRKFLYRKAIATADHCYGCTAGSGSSCEELLS